jgi:carbon-monoxide dehydrogenase small subunit
MLAVQANGREVRTLEGVAAADGTLSRVQQAMQDEHALQCGFCTPGVVMTLTALTEANPGIGHHELEDAVSGHICRCTGYQGIKKVVRRLTEGAA